jgi:uncharacterized protein YcbK (DUF882 family)
VRNTKKIKAQGAWLTSMSGPLNSVFGEKKMGDLSKNFSKHEFKCRHCDYGLSEGDVDPVLVSQLQEFRDKIGRPISITSGCRCKVHNRRVGGARNSQHVYGRAADIKVAGLSPKEVYRLLNAKYPKSHGIGLYRSWVHFDVRPTKARW